MGYCLTEYASFSPDETAELGERLARRLGPGSVIALRGGLGAGKTCLVKGIARGLGITENVTSPTYTIISEYAGAVPLYHIDAYRLSGDEDFENTGAGELLGRREGGNYGDRMERAYTPFRSGGRDNHRN